MQSFFKGIVLGIIIVLPGISGGTAFLILGLYHKILNDFSKLNLLPYLPILGGSLIGVFLGVLFLVFLFNLTRDITVGFLLGALLTSLKIIFKDRPRPSVLRLLILLIGILLGFALAGEPLTMTEAVANINGALLLIGGVLASATMLIPGISGSSVLIILGIYDELLYFVRALAFSQLLIFGVGSLAGFFLQAGLLREIYFTYKKPMTFFFAGLIIGSSKILLPSNWHPAVIAALLAGITLVWWWSERHSF